MVTGTYRGAQYPVISAEKESPVILFEGKRLTLPKETELSTERVARFAPAQAELTGELRNRRELVSDKPGDRISKGERFDLKLTAKPSRDLADCFVILVCFDDDSLTDSGVAPFSQIRVRELGALKAGHTSDFSFSSDVVFPLRYTDKPAVLASLIKMNAVWRLFSAGEEVRTGESPAAKDFFRNRELLAHRLAVSAWKGQNRSDNQPARPVLMIPPILESTERLPKNAPATLYISAEGLVTFVALDQSFPSPEEGIVLDALTAWLFLPAIKDGRAEAIRVNLPLKF
ncbi:MAG: hypothetical protein H7343_12475 [Undibacterium sp.]|nr:hypothetical protein [Opitutaceae bacterium]